MDPLTKIAYLVIDLSAVVREKLLDSLENTRFTQSAGTIIRMASFVSG